MQMRNDRRCRNLAKALRAFTERRFHGGADLVRAVHAARSDLTRRQGTVADIAPDHAGRWDSQTIADAARHSAPKDLGRLLYSLVRTNRPGRLIELGTNLGVSAAYIASALEINGSGRLVTLDFSSPRLILAEDLLSNLGLHSVELVHGKFDEHLEQAIEALGGVDFAFVDGDHQLDSTVRYFEAILDRSSSGALIVFDDIRWSAGMTEAWTVVSAHPELHRAFDLGRVGIVIVR